MTQRTRNLAGLLLGFALAAAAASWVSDLGFRVAPDGFGFENYGDKSPGGQAVTNLTAKEMALLFGETAVYKITSRGKVLTTPAANAMKQLNREMDGGHCEGMAALSLLMYADTVSPSTFGASTANELAIEGNAPLQREIARWFATQYTSPVSESESFVTPTNCVRALIAQLGLGKKSNPLYTVGIYKRNNGGGGHAMTPYAVYHQAGTLYYIYVYDNNYPNTATRMIAVDTGTDTWFYYASINPDEPSQLYDGDSTSANLSLTPITPRLRQQVADFDGTAPFAKTAGAGSTRNGMPIPASTWGGSGLEATALEMANGDDTHVVSLIASDHADSIDFWVADTQGRLLGRMNDVLINQIPNARILRSKGGGAPRLVVPAGLAFTVTVSGARLTDTATVSVSCAGEGTDLEISELELAPDRTDTVFFSPAGNRLCYVMGGEAVASLALCFHGAEEDFTFEAANIEAETGTRLEFAVEFDEERLRIANQSATGPAILDLAIQRIDEEDEDYFENDDFILPANDTGYLEFGE